MEERDKLCSRVCIKNLGDKPDEGKLRIMCEKYGVITSVSVVKDKHDSFRSFGLISFNRPEDAEKAVQALNGIDIDGNILAVSLGDGVNQNQQLQGPHYGVNVRVKNLDRDVTDEKLREIFSEYETITSAKVMRDSERSLGFGFVCFTSPDEASEAIREMNGRVVGSNFLNVQLAPKPEDFKVHSDDQYMQNFSSNKNVAEPLPSQIFGQPLQNPGSSSGSLPPFLQEQTSQVKGGFGHFDQSFPLQNRSQLQKGFSNTGWTFHDRNPRQSKRTFAFGNLNAPREHNAVSLISEQRQ